MLIVTLIASVVVIVLLALVRTRGGGSSTTSTLPPIQAMLFYLAQGAEHDVERPRRAEGLIEAVKRTRSADETEKAHELLRTVVKQGPPGQVQPALGAAYVLGLPDFEELLGTAVQRECLTREAWEAVKSQLAK